MIYKNIIRIVSSFLRSSIVCTVMHVIKDVFRTQRWSLNIDFIKNVECSNEFRNANSAVVTVDLPANP